MSVRRGLGLEAPREACVAVSSEGHAVPVLAAWQGSRPWQSPAICSLLCVSSSIVPERGY